MKVLLRQDMDKLGWLGDIVEVSEGYARNYLLPLKIAMVPSPANIKSLADAKVKRAEERQLAREQMERLAKEVAGAECTIPAKANEIGHLFGSISEKQIAQCLQAKGLSVTEEMIRIKEHIKEIGTHQVTVKIAADLTADIQVVVESQDGAVGSTEENIT